MLQTREGDRAAGGHIYREEEAGREISLSLSLSLELAMRWCLCSSSPSLWPFVWAPTSPTRLSARSAVASAAAAATTMTAARLCVCVSVCLGDQLLRPLPSDLQCVLVHSLSQYLAATGRPSTGLERNGAARERDQRWWEGASASLASNCCLSLSLLVDSSCALEHQELCLRHRASSGAHFPAGLRPRQTCSVLRVATKSRTEGTHRPSACAIVVVVHSPSLSPSLDPLRSGTGQPGREDAKMRKLSRTTAISLSLPRSSLNMPSVPYATECRSRCCRRRLGSARLATAWTINSLASQTSPPVHCLMQPESITVSYLAYAM